jgi:hypothetical protein
VAGRGCPPAAPCSSSTSDWAKKERRPRGFDSRAHLDLGRRREVDRREDSGVAAVLGGGGAVELVERGEGCCEAGSGEVRRPGEPPAPFIGGGRFGEGRFFRRARLRRARAASRGVAR